MKVILLRDVPKIGKKYDVKEVNQGYATNFLIPRKMAEPATESGLAKVTTLKQGAVAKQQIHSTLLENLLSEVEGKEIHLCEKANNEGSLFRALHSKDVADAFYKEYKITVDQAHISTATPLKKTGTHTATLLIEGRSVDFTVHIDPQ